MNIRKIVSLVLLSGAALVAPARAQDLNLGLIAEASTATLRQAWEPLVADLNKATGLNVSLFFATNYAGIIDGMKDGKVQVAFMGNKAAIEAVDRANGTVFAQAVAADGSLGYTSHLIVHASSPINDVKDVLKNAKTLSYGNGDLDSTSGYLVPEYYVYSKDGIDTKTAFRSSKNQNHEANALAVANKQVDVATNNSQNLAKIKDKYPEKFKEIKVIWTSPLIPLDPLVMRKDLAPAVAAKLKNFFFSYGSDERERAILVKIDGSKAFKESTDKQLIPVRQLGLFSDRNKVVANAALSDADKKAQLAVIDAKLKALQ
jgi:phosphonate transport system substrate-binding protein